MDWETAPDILARIKVIALSEAFPHVNIDHLYAVRGYNSSSRAIARIWSFPRVWQLVLNLPASYVIEIIPKKFDKLNKVDQDKVLIHELMHIPKTFSGSLVPHRNRGRHINHKNVDKIFDLIFARREPEARRFSPY